ncbi:DegT/DnrJ/EryC1/StrS family aminotransferase [candidate division KSB1 bacterium]
MNVPFVDLKSQYASIKEEMDSAIQDVLDNTAFIMGKHVSDFEENFAKLHNAKHCVGVSSGTSALYLALLAAGIKEGDEVIVPANTFIASSEAVTMCRAKVKFVDVNPKTYLIDLEKLKEAITPKTKTVMPVHLYGQMCDMEKIKKIADEHGLKIIEDAAQAHMAEFDGKKPGHYSDAACFSFYPGKNLGAYGDAGAVITNNEEIAKKVAAMRNHGRLPGEKYTHSFEAYNERIDALQARILSVKLKHINKWTDMRRKNAELYGKALKEKGIEGIELPYVDPKAKHVYHLYVIRLAGKDADFRKKLQEKLKEQGISSGVHYPIPLHMLKAYEYMGLKKGSFPVTEECSEQILSLPMFPELTEEQVNFVAEKLKEFLCAE